MPVTRWIPYVDAIQYDGTNSAEIIANIPNYLDDGPPGIPPVVVSETGGVLTLELEDTSHGPFTKVITVDDWVIFPQGFPLGQPGYGLGGIQVHSDTNPLAERPMGDLYIPDPS